MVPQKKMDLIEKRIRNSCRECAGGGCLSCRAQITRCKIYAAADIPMDYWMLAFKNFKGDENFKRFITSKLSDVSEMYEKGSSLAFVGNLGTGKTYAACCVLKMALVKGYSARYVNMADVIEETVKNNYKFLDKITNIDFLCIDEYDSRWVFPSEKAEQLFGQTMERILRARFQNGMPTIICSNTPNLSDVLAGDFSRAVDSLFSKYMEVLYVKGRDFRKIQK